MNMNLKGIMQSLGVKPGQVVSDPYARAFAPQPQIEIVKEEEDHEVSMAQNSLDTIIKMATELKAKMGESEKDIPAWIQDHITNAENYISQAASNYHEYGTNESLNEAITKKDIEKLGTYKDFDKFFKANKNKLNKKDLSYIEDEIGGLKWLESDYEDGEADREEVLVAVEEIQDLLKKSLGVKESVKEARLTSIVKSIVETPVIGKMVGSRVNEVVYNIGAGYMGNGLTIWNRAVKENGDYKIIAHIDPYGKISIRDKQMPSKIKSMIEDWADAMKKGNK